MASSNLGVQMVVLAGQRFVILPESEFRQLTGLPPQSSSSPVPAVAAMRAVLARDLVSDRERVGWSQAELARRAGIRVETLNRIETGKRSPSVATIEKLDAALQKATAKSVKR